MILLARLLLTPDPANWPYLGSEAACALGAGGGARPVPGPGDEGDGGPDGKNALPSSSSPIVGRVGRPLYVDCCDDWRFGVPDPDP